MEDASPRPPSRVDPYQVLSLAKDASAAEVKTAYKKLALKHHPGMLYIDCVKTITCNKAYPHGADKVAPNQRDTAHTKFQEVAFAYAILSDTSRRDRYDTTGSTADSISDDFNWSSFFKAQFAEIVTIDKLDSLKGTYQESEEERRDVLDSYKRHKGSLNKVFGDIMMSNVLVDEGRFREYIDDAIAAGDVQGFDSYVNETQNVRKKRKKAAKRENAEAMEHAKKLGVYESVFGNGSKGSREQNDLAGLIQQRQKQRAATFLDDLEAKYSGKGTSNGKTRSGKRKLSDDLSEVAPETNGKRRKGRSIAQIVDESSEEDEQERPLEEPPEEAFQAMAARAQKRGKVQATAEDLDSEESLGDEDTDEEDEEGEEEAGNGDKEREPDVGRYASEEPKPAKKAGSKRQTQRRRQRAKAKHGRK